MHQNSVFTNTNINNESIVETVNDYSKESYQMDLLKENSSDWDSDEFLLTAEEWKIAQNIPIHIPTPKLSTKNNYCKDLRPTTVLHLCNMQDQYCTAIQ